MTDTDGSRRLAFWGAAGFVPLWSTGILFGALAIRHGPPFAVTGLRFAAAAVVLALLAFAWRRPWPLGETLTWRLVLAILLGAAAVRLLQLEVRRGPS